MITSVDIRLIHKFERQFAAQVLMMLNPSLRVDSLQSVRSNYFIFLLMYA